MCAEGGGGGGEGKGKNDRKEKEEGGKNGDFFYKSVRMFFHMHSGHFSNI